MTCHPYPHNCLKKVLTMRADTNPPVVHMPASELQLAVCAHLIQCAVDQGIKWTLSDKSTCTRVSLHTSLMTLPDDTSGVQAAFMQGIEQLLAQHYPAYTWLTTPSANHVRMMQLLDEYNLPILAIMVVLDAQVLHFDLRRWSRVTRVVDLEPVKAVDLPHPGTACLSELGEGVSFRYCNDSTEEVYTLVEHLLTGDRVAIKTLQGKAGTVSNQARVIVVGLQEK